MDVFLVIQASGRWQYQHIPDLGNSNRARVATYPDIAITPQAALGREHAILWGSLRGKCDCLVVVCRAEAGIATTEGVLELIIQHGCSYVEEGLHRRPVPAHLLLLVHAFGDDLVDRTLHERGRDQFAIPAPGGVMDQRSLVPLEVGQYLTDVVFQAPDASHVVYIGTVRPAAQSREFAPESRPTPVPQSPLRPLQSVNRLA